MSKKQNIIDLYYEENMEIKTIANKVQVSRAYITKVIKADERYDKIKLKKKEETKQRKKEYTKYKMRELRSSKIREEATIRQQHYQATKELSGGYPIISNRAFRKWNSSAYNYNERKKCYVLNKKINATYSTPKYVK